MGLTEGARSGKGPRAGGTRAEISVARVGPVKIWGRRRTSRQKAQPGKGLHQGEVRPSEGHTAGFWWVGGRAAGAGPVFFRAVILSPRYRDGPKVEVPQGEDEIQGRKGEGHLLFGPCLA